MASAMRFWVTRGCIEHAHLEPLFFLAAPFLAALAAWMAVFALLFFIMAKSFRDATCCSTTCEIICNWNLFKPAYFW